MLTRRHLDVSNMDLCLIGTEQYLIKDRYEIEKKRPHYWKYKEM